ncbi:MAG: hypothetical protein AMS21_01070 [Gemmatimonas sp. SG8_38_2]|nr:MAG: hypothetical protein AMS21_01070 [Gemmatimonas sp. SG8_38_2]
MSEKRKRRRFVAWYGSGESLWVGPPSRDGKEWTKKEKLASGVDRCIGCDLDDYIESCAFEAQAALYDLGYGKLPFGVVYNMIVVALTERMLKRQAPMFVMTRYTHKELAEVFDQGFEEGIRADLNLLYTHADQRKLNPYNKLKDYERYVAWQLGWIKGSETQE